MHISDADLAGLIDRARAASQEPWQLGHSGTTSLEEAAAYVADTIAKSDQPNLHMVFVGDSTVEGATRVVAFTGNGPTSEANAFYLACLEPRHIIALCEELQSARQRLRCYPEEL